MEKWKMITTNDNDNAIKTEYEPVSQAETSFLQIIGTMKKVCLLLDGYAIV